MVKRLALTLAALATVCLAALPATALSETIERVEPPHWWTGFKNPKLQILLYGETISTLRPSVAAQGVTLERAIRVANPNYLFLDLHIDETARPGPVAITLSGAREHTLTYELKDREDGSAQRQGFGPSDVIYLILPDRFANGDTDNDTVEGYRDGLNREDDYGRHGGDIQGLINHLDYVAEMGFTQIWLNPVLENAMEEASYHGYATTDFYKVDPRYGDNALYRKFADEAKKRGIGLIKDIIPNHIGVDHWWMKDLPTPDWINNSGEYSETNHHRTTTLDPYAADIDRRKMLDGWFVSAMPDLNQRNPLMATYLTQNAIWWVEEVGLSGIRVDTYPYPEVSFLEDWTAAIMREYPNLNIVGEEWSLNPAVVARWQRGSTLMPGTTSSLPSLMDFPLQHAIYRGLTEDDTWGTGLIILYEMMANDVLYPDPYNLVTILDNHDKDRIHTQFGKDAALTKMSVAYLLTMRGIPQIYSGTELLQANDKPGDHGDIRRDFPGGWAGDTVNAFTGRNMPDDMRDMQDTMRKLLNWRKETPVLHRGKLLHFAPQNSTYTYFRYDDETIVMVTLNKNDDPIRLDRTRFDQILKGQDRARNIMTGRRVRVGDTIEVPARSAHILQFER